MTGTMSAKCSIWTSSLNTQQSSKTVALLSSFTNEETEEQKVVWLEELGFTLWHLPADTVFFATTPCRLGYKVKAVKKQAKIA